VARKLRTKDVSEEGQDYHGNPKPKQRKKRPLIDIDRKVKGTFDVEAEAGQGPVTLTWAGCHHSPGKKNIKIFNESKIPQEGHALGLVGPGDNYEGARDWPLLPTPPPPPPPPGHDF
jgi:hypothetical protein